jgi:hypothetical protein
MARVVYEESHQELLIRRYLSAMFAVRESYKNEAERRKFTFTAAAIFATDLAFLKSPAFSEEKEIRIVHLLGIRKDKFGFTLVDGGGTNLKGRKVKPSEVRYWLRDDLYIPYIALDFRDKRNRYLTEIVLGPKNPNHPNAIHFLLRAQKFEQVSVTNSKASYR